MAKHGHAEPGRKLWGHNTICAGYHVVQGCYPWIIPDVQSELIAGITIHSRTRIRISIYNIVECCRKTPGILICFPHCSADSSPGSPGGPSSTGDIYLYGDSLIWGRYA